MPSSRGSGPARRPVAAPARLCASVFAVAAAFAAGSAAQSPTATIAPKHIVYLLAGQSNVRRLNDPAPGCGAAAPGSNVRFAVAASALPTVGFSPVPAPAGEAMRYLLQELGQRHAPNLVDVISIGIDSSALLAQNCQPGAAAWIDSAWPTNPGTLVFALARPDPIWHALFALPSIAAYAQPADELHIVWYQGESDCYPGIATTTAEYWLWAQLVFATLAVQFGQPKFDVHLVTLGAIDSPLQNGAHADAVRDAFAWLDRAPPPFAWPKASIAIAAHSYDLPHAGGDPYHLTPCAYRALAERIVDGIEHPDRSPRVVGAQLTVVSDQELRIGTTVPLALTALDASRNRFFDVVVDGAPVGAFLTQALGNQLRIRVPAGGLAAATTIVVRHVPGSGHGRSWSSGVPPHGGPGGNRPLEPFVVTR